MIGIPCGPNGVFIIDIDCHDGGANGLAAFFEIMPRENPLPSGTITVRTANSGLHYWFKMPRAPLKSSAGKLAPGIDTRGAGGYVIAPGCSLPNRRQWRLLSPITIAEFSEQLSFQVLPPPSSWIVDALQGAAGRSLIKPAEQALIRECERVRDAPIGRRNDTLNTAAFAVGQLVIVRGGLNARVTVEARTIVRGPRRPLVPAPTMGAYDAALATSHALGGVRRLELTSLTIPDCVLLVTASC